MSDNFVEMGKIILIRRINKLPHDQHFFLFGARGVGKSTLIKSVFNHSKSLWLDLLNTDDESRFTRNPMQLEAIVLKLTSDVTHVVIDEIQKVPKLLDVVHRLIENKTVTQKFIMTGSSARKLKRGGANLLAGRAFVYHLYPFSYLEIKENLNLENTLNWGTLPKIYELDGENHQRQFLNAYAHTYLKEEIWAEQAVKQLEPFRHFLEVAAQNNGKIINYSNIARDVGVSDKIVKEYYTVLEDTLIGFHLNPFQHSFRKRLGNRPKFYLFDIGVTRSLARLLKVPVTKGTSYYGEVFEQFIILECIKLADYYQLDFRFSFLKTQSGLEIDLVVDRPGQPHLFIEIKSKSDVTLSDVSTLNELAEEFGNCQAICLSQDKFVKEIGCVTVYPWQEGIKEFFTD